MQNKQVKFANDLVTSPAYLAASRQGPPLRGDLTAAAENGQSPLPPPKGGFKKQKDDVSSAKKDLHGALTLVLNKVLAPLLLQKCWNYVVEDKPITYAQSAALCFGVVCVKSFANYSLRDV